jgi:hypothetical protein
MTRLKFSRRGLMKALIIGGAQRVDGGGGLHNGSRAQRSDEERAWKLPLLGWRCPQRLTTFVCYSSSSLFFFLSPPPVPGLVFCWRRQRRRCVDLSASTPPGLHLFLSKQLQHKSNPLPTKERAKERKKEKKGQLFDQCFSLPTTKKTPTPSQR